MVKQIAAVSPPWSLPRNSQFLRLIARTAATSVLTCCYRSPAGRPPCTAAFRPGGSERREKAGQAEKAGQGGESGTGRRKRDTGRRKRDRYDRRRKRDRYDIDKMGSFGLSLFWGQTDFISLWGQTDLEFSPLRPRARSSAMRSRLAFDSLWSRAANRADRLGTLSGRERPRIGTSSARVASVWCFAR